MSLIESLLISIALAADCFSIGITCGMIEKRFNLNQALLMALLFGFFQAAMPVGGWGISKTFYSQIEAFDHWIAFALLLLIGLRMIWESRHDDCEHAFNPNKPVTLVYLAFATSVDALAVGITFTCMGLVTVEHILQPIAIIGAGSFLLTLAGKAAGAFIGCRFNFNAELAGGIILILLGIKIAAGG